MKKPHKLTETTISQICYIAVFILSNCYLIYFFKKDDKDRFNLRVQVTFFIAIFFSTALRKISLKLFDCYRFRSGHYANKTKTILNQKDGLILKKKKLSKIDLIYISSLAYYVIYSAISLYCYKYLEDHANLHKVLVATLAILIIITTAIIPLYQYSRKQGKHKANTLISIDDKTFINFRETDAPESNPIKKK